MKKPEKGQPLKSLLGSNIRQLRGNLGFTLEKLAEKAKISVPYLGAIERGEKWPGAATLEGIALGLEAAPYDLLKPEDSKTRDIRKITKELIHEIETVVNLSVKKMNTLASDRS